MQRRILQRNFYLQDTRKVARELLGKLLVRQISGKRFSGVIVETEAYRGFDDTACHAHKGPTERCKVMFGEAGFAYVYLTYGIHFMLNFVTENKLFPAAVLIRAIEPVEGVEKMLERRDLPRRNRNPSHSKGDIKRRLENLTNGPGKLTKALNIKKSLNGIDLTKKSRVWVESDYVNASSDKIKIRKRRRIGIDYADETSRNQKWRFFIKGNQFVSR